MYSYSTQNHSHSVLIVLKQVGEHGGPNLSSLTTGQTVAVSVSSDGTLRLYVDSVDYGVVAHDASLSQCHVVVDVYGRCDKLSVADDCGTPTSLAVSDYQEKAATENGNC